MKLALAIIVKDELSQVSNILEKYSKYFDEVAIAVDYKYDEFCALKNTYKNLEVHQYQWINDFSHKRNFLADKIKSPYYFRIDTDDEIIRPERIREVFTNMISNNIDIIYFQYNYSQDVDGNMEANHWRETIIKKRADMYWKKAIHENVFIEDQNKFRGAKDDRVMILHNIDAEHANKSAERNWNFLINEFRQNPSNPDPRTVAYIGRMLIGWKRYAEAIKFLELLVEKSGWDDDKYFAYIHMSQCHQNLKKTDMAIACCNEALAIRTDWPDAYNRLGEIYIDKGDYRKAVDWLEIASKKNAPDTLFVLDNSVYLYRIKMNLSIAYFYIGDYEKANKLFNEVKSIVPKNDFIKSNEALFQKAYENDKYIKNLSWIVAYTKDKEEKKLENLVESIPTEMFKDERIMALRNMYAKPKTWVTNSVVIFCGPAWEDWAPPSVVSGIGGSEEAVIYVAKELTKLGKKVTVFCSCGEMAGEYEGVTYKEYFDFNNRDEFDVLIAWRHNIYVNPMNARKKIIWMHDVPDPNMFPEESLKSIDKIMVLSEYHKSLLPAHVPSEKVFVSANGINLKDFEAEQLRNPKRIIYTSSYDRGLQHLLEMWPDVKKQVPEAELHVFYGWNTYDAMVEKGFRSPDFKNAMVQMLNQPGVFEHGRVGHKQLAKEFLRSGVYAYPSHFEEISCISAMKAQAAGCVPVVTNYAALAETVKDGFKIDGRAGEFHVNENFKTALIDILNDVNKQEEIRKKLLSNKEQFGWDKVAKQWVDQLFV